MPKRHASDRRLSSLRVTAKEIGREVHAFRPPLPAAVGHRRGEAACFIVRDTNGQGLAFVFVRMSRVATLRRTLPKAHKETVTFENL